MARQEPAAETVERALAVVQTFGGSWTQRKLDAIRAYLDAYTTALKNRAFRLTYVDAFAGEGQWQPRAEYGEFHEVRDGSARRALEIRDKEFDRLVFVEQDTERCERLESLRAEYSTRSIDIRNEDANQAIPFICRDLARNDRLVVFLDPFAASVDWATVEALAKTKKADCWILFPLIAVSRMMPTGNEPAAPLQAKLDQVFGGREYWDSAYQQSPQPNLWGEQATVRLRGADIIANLYRTRLQNAFAGMASTRGVLRNSKGSPLFELFFAVSNPAAAPIAIPIAEHLLRKMAEE